LLTNLTYAGKVGYKGEVHDGELPSLVDAATWQRVQSLLQRNGRSGGGSVRNSLGFLLKGVLSCAACGCAMTPTHTRRKNRSYRYYVFATTYRPSASNDWTKTRPGRRWRRRSRHAWWTCWCGR
jgi:site-specific DNA recombinase